ncbi:MAG: preprotein translocase subunit SecE [Candidatus Peregrinibacteria bacterium]
MTSIIQYIRDSMEELHHVRWPTRNQAVRLSLIVITFTFGSAALYGIIDFLLAQAVKLLLSFTF